MNRNDFRIYAKYYDPIYLQMKDYQKEAEIVKKIIKRFERKRSKTLLDVGCGTGEHLKYLSSVFRCMGIDVNRSMIKIARNKLPNVRLKVDDMTDFRLKEKFDVITCLFSSIGYVQDFNNLVGTLENFYEHLNGQGLVLIEPWIFKKEFKKDYYINICEDEKMKLVRMGTSEIKDSKWLVFMHYLIGEKGRIKHFKELHKMLASNYKDYLKAFKSTKFTDVEFLKENLWEGCRGLFTAVKTSSGE